MLALRAGGIDDDKDVNEVGIIDGAHGGMTVVGGVTTGIILAIGATGGIIFAVTGGATGGIIFVTATDGGVILRDDVADESSEGALLETGGTITVDGMWVEAPK